MPVNNNRPFFNTRRIIKELPKAVIENKLEEVKPEVVVAETLKQADEDFVSFYDLDSKLLLDINNIHIISRTESDTNMTNNNKEHETNNTDSTNNDRTLIIINGSNETSIIDLEALFDNQDTINSDYIFQKLNIWHSDEKSGLGQLSKLIKNKLDSMNINNEYDAIELINCMIILINDKIGLENKIPPVLTKEAVNELNKKDIFTIINDIFNSDEITNMYYFGSIDGVIENSSQGKINDCWLIAGINALDTSEKGQSILADAIEKDEQNQVVTVHLRGVGKSYTFSYQEIENAKKTGCYSRGDKDVLLLELAMEKYMQECIQNNQLPSNWIVTSRDISQIGGALDGGQSHWLTDALIGNGSNNYHNNYKEETYFALQNVFDEFIQGNSILTCDFISENDADWGISIVPNHVYTISNIYIANPSDPKYNTVTIVNPWDSDKSCTISWEEFSKKVSTIEQSIIEQPLKTSIEKQNEKNSEYINDLFLKALNEELAFDDLVSIVTDISRYLDDDTKNVIIDKIVLFATEGHIQKDLLKRFATDFMHIDARYDFINPDEPIDNGWIVIYNAGNYSIKIGNNDNLSSYTNNEILKFTNKQEIINLYFDVVATKNNGPQVYQLKAGKTFDNFIFECSLIERESQPKTVKSEYTKEELEALGWLDAMNGIFIPNGYDNDGNQIYTTNNANYFINYNISDLFDQNKNNEAYNAILDALTRKNPSNYDYANRQLIRYTDNQIKGAVNTAIQRLMVNYNKYGIDYNLVDLYMTALEILKEGNITP